MPAPVLIYNFACANKYLSKYKHTTHHLGMELLVAHSLFILGEMEEGLLKNGTIGQFPKLLRSRKETVCANNRLVDALKARLTTSTDHESKYWIGQIFE